MLVGVGGVVFRLMFQKQFKKIWSALNGISIKRNISASATCCIVQDCCCRYD